MKILVAGLAVVVTCGGVLLTKIGISSANERNSKNIEQTTQINLKKSHHLLDYSQNTTEVEIDKNDKEVNSATKTNNVVDKIEKDLNNILKGSYTKDWDDKLEVEYGDDWDDLLESKYGDNWDDKFENKLCEVYGHNIDDCDHNDAYDENDID